MITEKTLVPCIGDGSNKGKGDKRDKAPPDMGTKEKIAMITHGETAERNVNHDDAFLMAPAAASERLAGKDEPRQEDREEAKKKKTKKTAKVESHPKVDKASVMTWEEVTCLLY